MFFFFCMLGEVYLEFFCFCPLVILSNVSGFDTADSGSLASLASQGNSALA